MCLPEVPATSKQFNFQANKPIPILPFVVWCVWFSPMLDCFSGGGGELLPPLWILFGLIEDRHFEVGRMTYMVNLGVADVFTTWANGYGRRLHFTYIICCSLSPIWTVIDVDSQRSTLWNSHVWAQEKAQSLVKCSFCCTAQPCRKVTIRCPKAAIFDVYGRHQEHPKSCQSHRCRNQCLRFEPWFIRQMPVFEWSRMARKCFASYMASLDLALISSAALSSGSRWTLGVF